MILKDSAMPANILVENYIYWLGNYYLNDSIKSKFKK